MSEEQTVEVEETTEVVAETTPELEAPTPVLSSNLKAIMDREAAIRDRESQLRSTQNERQEVDRLKDLARSRPFEFLEQVGVTMDRLESIKSEAGDPTKSLRRELEEVKKTIQIQSEQSAEERKMAQLEDVRRNVTKWVNKSEQYKLITAAGAQDLVYQKMLDHFSRTGEELSEHEAASEVNNQLIALARKLKPLVGDADVIEPEEVSEDSPTLTNQQAATSVNSKRAPTREEQLQAASQFLQYEEKDI